MAVGGLETPMPDVATTPSLREIAALYVSHLETRGLCERYIRSTESQIKRVLDFCAGAEPLQVQILGYMRARKRGCEPGCCHTKAQRRACRPASNRSVNMEVAALRMCLTWAVEEPKFLEKNPLVGIKPLSQTEADYARVPHPLTDDEAKRFLKASRERDRRYEHPQTPLWRLLLEVGIRWGDAIAIRPEHLQGDVLLIRADTTKGRRLREIPLPRGLASELRVPLVTPTGRPWTQASLPNARKLLLALLEKAGIPRVDAAGRTVYLHALRASAATAMYRRGWRVPAIAGMLGHVDATMTQRRYIRPGLAELQMEMDRAPTTVEA